MSTGMWRSAGSALRRSQHLVAVEVGHHHVEQDQVDRLRAAERGERRAPAGGGADVVALAREPAGEHVAVLLVVVHDEDDAAGAAGCRPSRAAAVAAGRAARRPRRRQQRGRGGPRPARSADVVRGRRAGPARRPRARAASVVAVARCARAAAVSSAARGDQVQRRRRRAARRSEPLVDEPRGARRASPRMLAEARGEAPRDSRRVLEQHLGVAEDVVERRAQLVAELRERGSIGHGAGVRVRGAPRSFRAGARARPASCRSRRSRPRAPSRGRRPWRAR